MTPPTCRFLSLGAGVQSSATLLLAVRGRIPTFDAAIFADTGWEPANVYRQLARLTRIAGQAGIPVVRVSNGHIRKDALDSGTGSRRCPCSPSDPAANAGWRAASAPPNTKSARSRPRSAAASAIPTRRGVTVSDSCHFSGPVVTARGTGFRSVGPAEFLWLAEWGRER